MFALGIRYLNGWSMAAADGARKERAEWPPHPDRVFMALAAAWFETGEDLEEGKALRWLEALSPPEIAASEATNRTTVVSYVPVNDVRRVGSKLPADNTLKKLKKAGLTLLPEHRSRQPRSFPVAIPANPTVHMIWPDAELREHRNALEQLAAKVTHLGHPASFVHAWVEENVDIHPTWEPSEGIAKHRLRIPAAGRLDNLIRTCNRAQVLEYYDLIAQAKELKGKEKKRIQEMIEKRFGKNIPVSLRPVPICWQGYDRPQETKEIEEPCSVFDPQLIVLSIKGRTVSLPATLRLTQALRGAVMNSCPEHPPPEWLSGHKRDGKPSVEPHLGFVPLPFVGDPHADGRIMGLALVLPRKLGLHEAGQSLEKFLYDSTTGLIRECQLFDSTWFECTVELENRDRPPKNLNPNTWTRKSRVWASVTPVVLNRHFDGKDKWERASESIKDACTHVGLPHPYKVMLHPVSAVNGVPHAKQYPQLPRKKDGGNRSHSHAVIVFEEPVRGPVLIGAGRFRGYGFCRPMDRLGDDHD